MGLVVSMKVGERTRIRMPDGRVGWVMLGKILSDGKARILFDFPKDVLIHRESVLCKLNSTQGASDASSPEQHP